MKLFQKYFPIEEVRWPPLHVAERMAREEGIQLPKSLILKLTAQEGNNLHKIVNDSRCHAWVTAAVISPLAAQNMKPKSRGHSPSNSSQKGEKGRDSMEGYLAAPNLDMDDLDDAQKNDPKSIGLKVEVGNRKQFCSATSLLKVHETVSNSQMDNEQSSYVHSTSLANRSSSLNDVLICRLDTV